MNKIDKNKKYKTKSGLDVTIYTTEANVKNSLYCVFGCIHGEDSDSLETFTINGTYNFGASNSNGAYDLVEVTPWSELKVDDRVLVRGEGDDTWTKRYFAGINSKGKPTCFESGTTSWSTRNVEHTQWDECIPYVEGEDYGV